jgi:hypothetical protein
MKILQSVLICEAFAVGSRGRTPVDRSLDSRSDPADEQANPWWGAQPIPGELLRLVIEIANSIAKYMVPTLRRPASQSWKTFLRNHATAMASIDPFVVPTAFSHCSMGR